MAVIDTGLKETQKEQTAMKKQIELMEENSPAMKLKKRKSGAADVGHREVPEQESETSSPLKGRGPARKHLTLRKQET